MSDVSDLINLRWYERQYAKTLMTCNPIVSVEKVLESFKRELQIGGLRSYGA